MAEKLVRRLQNVQDDLKEITGVLRNAQNVSEDDLFDGEYFVDQLNKTVRKLKTLSKNYEGCSSSNANNQQGVMSLSPGPDISYIDDGCVAKEDSHIVVEEKCADPPTPSPPAGEAQKVSCQLRVFCGIQWKNLKCGDRKNKIK